MSIQRPCNFHPTRTAQYQCPKCQASLCEACISKRKHEVYGTSRYSFFCPKCNVPAEMLNVGSFLPPFWMRLPRFFAYPLHLKPLVLILALSSAGVWLSWVPFVHVVLWGVLVKYSYAVLRNTVTGNLRPPDLSQEVIWEDFGQAFKQIGLFLIVGIALGLAFAQFGRVVGIVCLLAVLLLMPAMIIVLAVSESLINALNPVGVVTIAYRIGWGYLLMYLFLVLLLAAPIALAGTMGSFLPPLLHQFLFIAANQYYTIISYNLMGYVILQYHEEIGYEVNADEFFDQAPILKGDAASSADSDAAATEAVLSQVTLLIKDGRAEDAVFLLRDKLRARPSDRVLFERYYNLLKVTQRTSEILPHGVAYLDLLAAASEKADACEVYRECLALDPQFTPNPEALFKIAAWCSEDGDAAGGLRAFARFVKKAPEHPLAPKAYFMFGRNLNEKLHDAVQAEKVLRELVKKYPNHDIAHHALEYIGQMKKA